MREVLICGYGVVLYLKKSSAIFVSRMFRGKMICCRSSVVIGCLQMAGPSFAAGKWRAGKVWLLRHELGFDFASSTGRQRLFGKQHVISDLHLETHTLD